jgi:hypothetical protein
VPARPGPACVALTPSPVQILCGYDTATKQFDICDPACDSPRYTVPESQLETARKSFGTDEDILIMSSPI